MSKITGTGCQLSGMTTAFIVANPDNVLEATAAAVCTMGLAGEIAFANMAETDGNSTYRNRIIDAIYNMDAETLEKEQSMNCDKKDLLLYAVTDRAWLNGETLCSQVEKAIKGGATFIQLREKTLTKSIFLKRLLKFRNSAKSTMFPS